MRDVEVFVSPRGNAFMRDIASWIVEAAEIEGRRSRLVDDGRLPDDPGVINLVVAPHELYLLSDADDSTIHRAAQLSVPVCTEQPGTPWFDIALTVVRSSQIVLDINQHGVAAFDELGIDVRHLRLGGVPSMVAQVVDRDIDVVFLGGETLRRGAELARLAPHLWNRSADLRVFSFARPVLDGFPGLVFGAEKYELLARSGILLNIHRSDAKPGYFEWARMVEAMANGCCIVTESVTGFEPYEAGTHFMVADDIEHTLVEVLDDTARQRTIGEAARAAVMHQFPLAASLGPLLTDLDGRDFTPEPARRSPRYRRHMTVAQQHPLLPAFRPSEALRAATYHALMAETALLRRIDRARSLLRHGVEDHVERTTTAAYADASPAVSVVVTLYNYAHVVIETLQSLVDSVGAEIEVIVVDDHSSDDGRDVVAEFMSRHQDVAMLLLGSDINRGLPAARNLAIGEARADLVMMMDADNLVYPTALSRLAAALDADPRAAFAYSTLEEFGVEPGVRSAMAWNVGRLCDSNYIDAQALIRRSALQRHGGYRTDDELIFGWEDWELWLRFAEAGEYGVHVPQMLGRYRTQAHSMISTTNLVADAMYRHIRELHPGLPWPTD